MDRSRFEELKRKRSEDGLTDREAGELGRMFAEEMGGEYRSAQQFRAEEETEDTATSLRQRHEVLKEIAETGDAPEADLPAGSRQPIGANVEEAEEAEEKKQVS